jgi:DNA-binding winged helix-turn-helix (wHTH) protein/tetratricopeptide (TPR) repeat protein
MEFQFGDWLVSPEANIVSNGDAKTQLEPRVMAVLRYLCRHPGAVIPAEEILQACWGSNELGDNPVHKAITQLRRAFGDSTTDPRYIETIRKRGYRAIAPVVTLASPAQAVWEGGSPFRGLEAFQENHAAIFFGRVQATAQLRELVMNQAAHGCPMALVLGPSGSGKTSLVRAGLMPQLMAGATRSDDPIGLVSTVYLDCADLGSGTLFQALAGALIDAEINGQPLFPGASADSLGQRLATDPDAVATELRERACPRVQVGVFVDRLEAVFRAESAEADRFISVIEALAKSNCLLMLMACRNDFYPEVMAQPVLLTLKSRCGHFDVLPPDGADIAQIVRQPALAAGLAFEKDEVTGASLDDVLCDASRGNPDMLPLLQYTLNELYRQRESDGVLRFDVYRQLGGIEGAVGVRAEQVVARLSLPQIGSLPHVLSLLVSVGEDQGAVTSRRSPLALLRSEDERELVRVMVEARLFVSELAGDVPSFGVAHEALLRRWARVSEWIERYRSALQLRARLESQASRWDLSDRPRDQLLPSGSQVNQATELLKLSDFSLSVTAREFIRESESRAKFGERLRLSVTALIAFLAVAAGSLGLIARNAQQTAEKQRAEAEGLLTYMLGDFVDKLRPLGRLELLDDISKKAMSYLVQPSSSSDANSTIVQRAKALHVITEVHLSRAKRAEANEALVAASQLLRALPESQRSDKAALRELGMNAFLRGQSHIALSEWVQAEQCMSDYLEYATKRAAVDPNDVDGWVEQSYAHNSLGSIAMRLSNFSKAAKEFDNSRSLKLRALEKRPDSQSLSVDLANSYSWLAESRLKLGELSQAMQLYQEEEKLLRRVHEGNATWTYRLSLSLVRQATVQLARGDNAAAINSYAQAERLLQKIVNQDPSNRAWVSRLYLTQARQIELVDDDKSLDRFDRLRELCDKLLAMVAKDPKNATLAQQTLKLQHSLAMLLAEKGRQGEALTLLNAVIDALEQHHRAAKDTTATNYLSEALLTRAELERNSKKLAASQADCARAAQILSAPDKTDFALIALQVRANFCAGTADQVAQQVKSLEKMGFREVRYLRSINTH